MTIIHYRVWSKDQTHMLACGWLDPRVQYTDRMTLTTCHECLATFPEEELKKQKESDSEYWESRALIAEKQIKESETWAAYYKDQLTILQENLQTIQLSAAGWERAAIGHRERWQARTQDFIQARKERDQYFDLLISVEKVIRPWLSDNPSTDIYDLPVELVEPYDQIKAAIVLVKGKENE